MLLGMDRFPICGNSRVVLHFLKVSVFRCEAS